MNEIIEENNSQMENGKKQMKLIKLLQSIKKKPSQSASMQLLNAVLHGCDAIWFFKICMRLTWKQIVTFLYMTRVLNQGTKK